MPVLCLLCLYYAFYACTMPVLCLLCLYYACTMPTMLVLCLYYAYYACTMPTMPVLCLLCLYYACTMPTMPVLCLLCLFITTGFVEVHRNKCLFTYVRAAKQHKHSLTRHPQFCTFGFTENAINSFFCFKTKSHCRSISSYHNSTGALNKFCVRRR